MSYKMRKGQSIVLSLFRGSPKKEKSFECEKEKVVVRINKSRRCCLYENHEVSIVGNFNKGYESKRCI